MKSSFLNYRCGRRNPLVWAVFLQLAAGIASSFAPWFWLFCVFRFLTALATGGTMITRYLILNALYVMYLLH